MKRFTIKKLYLLAALCFLVFAIVLIARSVVMYGGLLPSSGSTEVIAQEQSLKGIEPRSPVTIEMEIEAGKYESLLVKTVYTGLELFANDVLIYECGQEGSYPAWLLDPPTMLQIVPLPPAQNAIHLRFEYISPSQRTTMSVPALKGGNESALLAELIIENSMILIISSFMMMIGIFVTIMVLLLWRNNKGLLIYGLGAFAAGAWGFSECDATLLFVPYPALLYIVALGTFFIYVVPYLYFGLHILKPRHPLPMQVCAGVTYACFIIALLCQLTGTVSLSRVLPIFQFFALLGLAVFLATVIMEAVHYKSEIAKQVLLPSSIFIVAAMIEFANYVLRFASLQTPIFIAGAFVQTVWLGFISVRMALKVQEEKNALEQQSKWKAGLLRELSHELKTPLTVISNVSQLALLHTGDDYVRAKLDIAVAEIDSMKHTVKQIFELSQAPDVGSRPREGDEP